VWVPNITEPFGCFPRGWLSHYPLNGHDVSENCCDEAGDRGSSGIWIRYNPLLSLLRDFCRTEEHR